jgi:hypothetical protein
MPGRHQAGSGPSDTGEVACRSGRGGAITHGRWRHPVVDAALTAKRRRVIPHWKRGADLPPGLTPVSDGTPLPSSGRRTGLPFFPVGTKCRLREGAMQSPISQPSCFLYGIQAPSPPCISASSGSGSWFAAGQPSAPALHARAATSKRIRLVFRGEVRRISLPRLEGNRWSSPRYPQRP